VTIECCHAQRCLPILARFVTTRSTDLAHPAACHRREVLDRADGELEPLVEGSTKPVAQTVRHAGIVQVNRFSLDMP
jgi:hypothetical protein